MVELGFTSYAEMYESFVSIDYTYLMFNRCALEGCTATECGLQNKHCNSTSFECTAEYVTCTNYGVQMQWPSSQKLLKYSAGIVWFSFGMKDMFLTSDFRNKFVTN